MKSPPTFQRTFFILVCLLWTLSQALQAEPSRLDLALSRGELRVGTTGDYKPFTHRAGKVYRGYDIEIAKLMAAKLHLKLTLVPTTWKTLTDDLKAGQFDLAVGGITRTFDRQTRANFSRPTLAIGKCALVRKDSVERFTCLADIDQPSVKVGVNPGGTNERYVRQNVHKATIVVIEDNLKIPDLVAEGRLDVMLTDNVEALNEARNDVRLATVSADSPWTSESLGFLVGRDDIALVNWINLFLEISEANGTLRRLRNKHRLPSQ